MKQPDSNSLRRELARSQQAGSHPDSELLTAFAEGSLLARERASVLEHLALCVRCREGLSIAADASSELSSELQPLPLPGPTRPPLRSWLPWAAAAAGVLIVSSALLLHERWKPGDEARFGKGTSAATKEIAQTTAQPSPLSSPPPEAKPMAAPHRTPDSVGRAGPTTRRQETTVVASVAPVQPAPLPVQNVQAVPPQSEAANANDNLVSSSPAPSAKRVASPGPRAEGLSAVLQQSQRNPDQAARVKAIPPSSEVVEVQGAVNSDSAAGFTDAGSAAMAHKAAPARAARQLWRINEFGQLGSTSGGGSWQSVPMSEQGSYALFRCMGAKFGLAARTSG